MLVADDILAMGGQGDTHCPFLILNRGQAREYVLFRTWGFRNAGMCSWGCSYRMFSSLCFLVIVVAR